MLLVRNIFRGFRAKRTRTAPTFEKELTLSKTTYEELFLLKEDFHFFSSSLREWKKDLSTMDLSISEKVVAEARRALDHELRFLGVEYRSDKMPWFLDPVRKLEFPRNIPIGDWNLFAMRPKNADIKYPWELSRMQHFPCLWQAFIMTGNETFAREILEQIIDFTEHNPPGIGINWTCTMDVGLRAASWAIALEILKEGYSDDPQYKKCVESLYDHGIFIRGHLENHYEVTSNHYLSNIVGLYFLGMFFRPLIVGQSWLDFSREELEKEIFVQIRKDGMDYESSILYHRLVTELFLAPMICGDFNKAPMSPAYKNKLKSMVEFYNALLRPDGTMPIVGDCDDGRFMIASSYYNWRVNDGRYLSNLGAYFLKTELCFEQGPEEMMELRSWGAAPVQAARKNKTRETRMFLDSGFAVSKDQANYLLFTNSVVGTNGFGNHKHNDQLSFELMLNGELLIVDPGSYVYTSDFEGRNLFRSTEYHNTVKVGEQEQNEFRGDWLFRMFERSTPSEIQLEENVEHVLLKSQLLVYDEEKAKIYTHSRTLDFRINSSLHIRDFVEADGQIRTCSFFHLAPDVFAENKAPGTLRLVSRGKEFQFNSPLSDIKIEESFFSPSYGVRIPSKRIVVPACSNKSLSYSFSAI